MSTHDPSELLSAFGRAVRTLRTARGISLDDKVDSPVRRGRPPEFDLRPVIEEHLRVHARCRPDPQLKGWPLDRATTNADGVGVTRGLFEEAANQPEPKATTTLHLRAWSDGHTGGFARWTGAELVGWGSGSGAVPTRCHSWPRARRFGSVGCAPLALVVRAPSVGM